MTISTEQQDTFTRLQRIIDIFLNSECSLRPHFWLVGPSGSGKSWSVQQLAFQNQLNFIEINAAQLTREGVSGNSLSKAMSSLRNFAGKPTIVFVDEFDKLFIAGNDNSEMAHDSTTAVQNEFLKVVESDSAQVFSNYGKYVSTSTEKCLFIFAGAFNGKQDLTIDDMRDYGVKTEFLGRIALIFNIQPPSLSSLLGLLKTSPILMDYCQLFPQVNPDEAYEAIATEVAKNFEQNTLGVRMVNTLIHQYFIYDGDFAANKVKNTAVFSKALTFGKKP